MATGTGIIFFTLLLGSLAFKLENVGLSKFFDDVEDSPSSNDFDVQGRIVGGRVAAIGAHPWMVAFTHGAEARIMHCGGSIISRRTVLTAAHCVYVARQGSTVASHVRLNVGTNRYNSGGQSLSVSGQIMHPAYRNVVPPRNDIAVMFTSSNINFGANVRPIALSWDNIGAGMPARLAGWGFIRTAGPASEQLLEIDVPVMNVQRCNEMIYAFGYRNTVVDPQLEICTFHSVGHGACSQDSGSPLVRRDRSEQIGVVAWGFPCAVGLPDVFARVSAYRSWIQNNMRH